MASWGVNLRSLEYTGRDWMEQVVKFKPDTPLCMAHIPGSHDSGTFWLNISKGLARDQQYLKYLRPFDFGCISKFTCRWSKTQSLTFLEQLNLGIRYLDIRTEVTLDDDIIEDVMKVQKGSKIYNKIRDWILPRRRGFIKRLYSFATRAFIVHGLYGVSCDQMFDDVYNFLKKNPGEVVILDFNHVYNMNEKDFLKHVMQRYIRKYDVKFLCKNTVNLRIVDIRELQRLDQRLILIGPYKNPIHDHLFSSTSIKSPWPNVDKVCDLEEHLKHEVRKPFHTGLRVIQGNLTARISDIITSPKETLKESYSIPARDCVVDWVKHINGAELWHTNIVTADEVNPEFSDVVISRNFEQIKWK